jgi:drug/metabolite transporter (DMT)-like permease
MLSAIITVLFSGFFHALWNVCTKKSLNKIAFLFSVQMASVIAFAPIFLPKLLQINFISLAGLLFLLSMLAHGIYFIFLARLYTIADLSQSYPIIRGSSLLIIPLFGVLFLKEDLSIIGRIGIATIISGIFFISEIRISRLNYKILLLSLAAGLAIAFYIAIDKLALKYIDAISLNQIGTLGNIIALLPFILKDRGQNLKQEWKLNYKSIMIGAILAPLSYVLFLWAIKIAPISVLAPIREFGTVFGALIGVIFLKEKNGRNRIISSIIITIGMVLLAVFN